MSVSGIGAAGVAGVGATASSAWNNPQLLQALLPNYNVQALDQAMQAEVSADALPLQQLSSQLSTLQSQQSAWQALQTDLGNLQQDAQSLAGSSLYQTITATSSDPTSLTATAGTGATGGSATYSVAVSSLAQPEINISNAQSSGTAALDLTGSFLINGTSVSVGPGDSLETIAASINNAGAGVTATVLPGQNGYYLTISGTTGGAISYGDPNGILSTLGITTNTPVQAGSLAEYTINGVAFQSKTNSATGIPGLTLTFNSTIPSSAPAVVSVSQNQGAITSAVQQFATDYNALLGDVAKYSGAGSALAGNAAVLSISNTLNNALTAVLPGQPAGYQSLAQIGVTVSAPVGSPSDMSMSVNSATLQAALQANPTAVAALLNGSGGVATQLQQDLNMYVGPTGSVNSQITALQSQTGQIGSEINDPNSAINLQIAFQQQELVSEFQNMLTALASSQAQSQQIQGFINAQYGSQNGVGGGGSSGGG